MKNILNQLYQHKKLSKSEAKQILIKIAGGAYNEAHLASFMTVFMMRPISVNELSGFRDALKELSLKAGFKTVTPGHRHGFGISNTIKCLRKKKIRDSKYDI